jgi:hypothetical protein
MDLGRAIIKGNIFGQKRFTTSTENIPRFKKWCSVNYTINGEGISPTLILHTQG